MEPSQSPSVTPGNIRYLPSYNLFDTYNRTKLQTQNLNEKDTYIYIFNLYKARTWTAPNEMTENPGQKELYDTLINHRNIKVLWKSPLAVNRRSGHGTFPRNTMVVFEYVESMKHE